MGDECFKKHHASRQDSGMDRHKDKIAPTDRQRDPLVYGLYKLTDDEIKMVEEAVSA